jgi:dihydroorotate dehydrogenase (fumarate)/dihydroorotate dehydrogenase
MASLYESVLRPLLFRLNADTSHELARAALRIGPPWQALGGRSRVDDARLATQLAGLELANPIGLAPGFDKNAELLPSLSQLGFGYICVGSITPLPRQGNPLPRLTRYADRQAVANCMGMPNRGLAEAVRQLRTTRVTTPIVASVAGFSGQELFDAAKAVAPYVAAVEIGLVCPNTTDEERMDEMRIFSWLAERLAADIAPRKPVFVKLPPHHSEDDWARTAAMLDVCIGAGLQGVSVSGTKRIEDPRLSLGEGSIAGRPVFADALRITRDVAEHGRGRLAVKAAGGVFTGSDAAELLRAGADTVELYSAFIYRGWDVAGRIKRELLDLLRERGIASVRDLRALASALANA